ncbi:MAG TPA: radical SAM protein [Spirochaetota bacterium]|jgi:wyosine [tRNA(Phe)-imidazoG37] synthetase (radical SAM superfamily)|nr:radical SAM protein [Spirochaetota bacterium]HPD03870.1 radical SAM protein [Spirochaetota bacterium]HPK45425.1 radical SAM protein [Spirochaetota bacterium]HQG43639.1 radical SAM protein [Spirochaetota bacterium]HRR60818.1 radical SAM protein [Spirochaetota bacterium]
MYTYLFGPVPSRRLGISLGVDLIPHKTCTLNCIYCECGKTTKLTIERKEWVPINDVIDELKRYLNENPCPEYITFSGSGEPTLHTGIGIILDFLKEQHGTFKTAVLTNGTLLYMPQVREELLGADVVIPSLDAATQETFKKINMPHPSLNIQTIINGITEFKKIFKGKLILEIFIIPEINDNNNDLDALKHAILTIHPDEVQLNTLDRPGILSSIRAATMDELEHIIQYWQLPNVSIISSPSSHIDKVHTAYRYDIESAILETIARRPCTVNDIAQIININSDELNKYLDDLEAQRKITRVVQNRGIFYKKV